MSITHIVLFQFKADIEPRIIKDVWCLNLCQHLCKVANNNYKKTCDRLLALRDNCLHATSQKPYIKAVSGGADNSPEGKQVCSQIRSSYAPATT
jgi:hypothetical protein